MNLSVEVAKHHFKAKIIPRRVRDYDAERRAALKGKKGRPIMRKLSRKVTGGDYYSIFSFNFLELADFGLGISVYFMQLLLLAVINLIAAIIMIPAISEYTKFSFGLQSTDPRLAISGACEMLTEVIATVGCSSNSTCRVSRRENCPFPKAAAISNLTMCIFLVCALNLAKYIEIFMKHRLDEAIQTAQDYSIVVSDPNPDATDPDEWFHFFSRFGNVRYVTVARANGNLSKLLLKRHILLRHLVDEQDKVITKEMIDNLPKINLFTKAAQSLGFFHDRSYFIRKLHQLDELLDISLKLTYPVCNVFITFEYEDHQRLCLRELGVDNMSAQLDTGHGKLKKHMFRNNNILRVDEPGEPDDVIWTNIEYGVNENRLRKIFSLFICSGVMVMTYILYMAIQDINNQYLAFAVIIVDTVAPMLFEFISNAFERPIREADRQDSLLIKLYMMRMLTSTIFPFVAADWNSIIGASNIKNIFNVQIAACFTSPLLRSIDLKGKFMRSFISRLFSDDQADMLSYWNGTHWQLSERYSAACKIMFVSLFYAMLNPSSLLVACIATVVVYFADRYLLLRRWKPVPLLGPSMVKRVRQMIYTAIAAELYISTLFIYSWPIDEAFLRPDGQWQKVNKTPQYIPWLWEEQYWQSDHQRNLFITYSWSTNIAIVLLVLELFGHTVFVILYHLFVIRESKPIGKSQGVPYSSVKNIFAYVPVIREKEDIFSVADTSNMLDRHKPEVVSCIDGEELDIGLQIPEEIRRSVLSTIRWYGEKDAEKEKASKEIKIGRIPLLVEPTNSHLTSPIRNRFNRSSPDDDGNGNGNGALETRKVDLDLVGSPNGIRKPFRRGLSSSLPTPLSSTTATGAAASAVIPPASASALPQREDTRRASFRRNTNPKGERPSLSKSRSVRPSDESNDDRPSAFGNIYSSAINPAPANSVYVLKNGVIQSSKQLTESNPETEELSFNREELNLLRQIRRELLKPVRSQSNIQSRTLGNPSSAELYVLFSDFYVLAAEISPLAVTGQLNANKSNLRREAPVVFSKGKSNSSSSKQILRNVFIKFLYFQSKESAASAAAAASGKLDWQLFLRFVQMGSGDIAAYNEKIILK